MDQTWIQTRNLLTRARDAYRDHGGAKGGYRYNGRVCAVGAIQEAYDINSEILVFSHAVRELSDLARSLGYENIVYFNDADSTTKDDVLRMFDLALAEMEAAE